MKKIISLILSVLMLISATASVSSAESEESFADKLDFSEKFFNDSITILLTPVVKQADTNPETVQSLGYETYLEAADYVVKLLDKLGVDVYYTEKRSKSQSVHFGHIAIEDDGEDSICGYKFLSGRDEKNYDDIPNGTKIYPVVYVDINNYRDGNEGGSINKVITEIKKFDGCDEVYSVTPEYEKQNFTFIVTPNDEKTNPWYLEAVQYCLTYELMSGVCEPANVNWGFEPETAVTRAMAVKTLHNMEGKPKASDDAPAFSDVGTDWYTDAVKWASKNEITKGVSEDLFAPNQAITREQFSVFLYKYAALKGYDTKGQSDLSKFKDNADVSEYAKEALAWANHEGYITGMGNDRLEPQGQLTRAQLASILMRFTKAHKS